MGKNFKDMGEEIEILGKIFTPGCIATAAMFVCLFMWTARRGRSKLQPLQCECPLVGI